MAKSFKPDAVVLDLLLPKKNGFEVLEILKSDQELKIIPVVVVSNLGEDSDIKRALSLGAADYYVKSEHPLNEIVEKVENVILQSK
jgi:DNA-binding response OmpR family regulator